MSVPSARSLTEDELGRLDLCVTEFSARVRATDRRDIDAPTPCTEWTVHDLVHHVIDGNRLAVALLTGRTARTSTGTGEWTSTVTRLGESVEEQRAAFAEANPKDLLEHPAGVVTAEDYVALRGADIAVHAWDLAKATDGDSELPDQVITEVLDPYVRWIGETGAAGAFATRLPVAPESQGLAARLRRLGRDPEWQPRPS